MTQQRTNDEKPFEPGELIAFSGDRYEVLENRGDSGTVMPQGDGCYKVQNFKWTFCGEKCVRIGASS